MALTVARSWRSFSDYPTTKFRKIFRYFSGFLFLCNKISFLELKEVLFTLFSLKKFVFNTPNKNLSQAVSLCTYIYY
jgi:hypothetical protein